MRSTSRSIFHFEFRCVSRFCILAALICAGCGDGESVDENAETLRQNELSINFAEQAEVTGLTFRHVNGESDDNYYLPWIMGSGVALLDYDADGDLDVYFVQSGTLTAASEPETTGTLSEERSQYTNRLFENQLRPSGRLEFRDITDQAGVGDHGYGMGVAVGDVDNDGYPDLFVTNFGQDTFYRNNGDGFYSRIDGPWDHFMAPWSASASFIDYDLDGDLDLYVAQYIDFTIGNNRRCFGTTGRRDYCGPDSYRPLKDRLFRNDGDWRFTDVSESSGIEQATGSGLGVVAADFNGNGLPDLFVANDAMANQLWINQGDGRFMDEALLSGAAVNMDGLAEAGMGVTAGDFDLDGDEDLFLSHLTGETNTLYRNNGSGGFFDSTAVSGLGSPSLPFTGFGTAWFDYDNDGLLDLFVANGSVTAIESKLAGSKSGYAQRDQLFINRGDGRFEEARSQLLDTQAVGRGSAFGDIDNDGDIDIVVSNNNGPARLLINNSGRQTSWLRVRLIGVESNRDATSARVALLRKGQPTIWRHVHTDGSYLSANDRRIHFGLGDSAGSSPSVGVIWPAGRNELWKDVSANREHVIREGGGTEWLDAPD